MTIAVTMPRLGESVTEGTVTRWLKQEGERVELDEPLLEVSTDKADTEIPSPGSGIVQQILVQEDETAEVGVQLAIHSQLTAAQRYLHTLPDADEHAVAAFERIRSRSLPPPVDAAEDAEDAGTPPGTSSAKNPPEITPRWAT